MRGSPARFLLHSITLCACIMGAARADVLLDQTSLIGLPGVAPPVEYSFTASTAQALTLTLTDLAIPAAFGSLEVAVTLNDALVGTATVSATTHTGTFAIPAAAGNYMLHVIGVPDATQGIGNFGICVAPTASAASCSVYQNSGSITTPATTSATGTSTLTTNFTSTTAGTYTVTLSDDTFPAALQLLSAGVFNGSTPILVGILPGSTGITLAAKTSYQLQVAAQAGAATEAGLYGIRITDPSGAIVFDRTLPVGTLPGSTIVASPTAQSLSVTLTDYAYPAALASAGVAVTQGSTLLTELTEPGSATNFPATAGNVEVWQYAVAGTQPGTYSLNLSVYQSNPVSNIFSTTQVVNPTPSTAATSFAFIANLPTAGTYQLVVNDFQFPGALQSISSPTVAQNGTLLPLTSGNFTAVQGPVVVLVDATPPTGSLGIFGVTVQTTGASPSVVLDQTQAVGGIFNTQKLTLGISGNFAATLADLKFPQAFGSLAVVLSQNSLVLGKVYAEGGSGTFQYNATPGNYVVTLVAIPNSTAIAPPSLANYGLYSLHVASAPPTVTLTSSPTSVTAGGAVTLTWSSQSATACTASGGTGWSGSEATSGTLSIAVSATETLTLTCTGPGGSAADSVTVTTTAAAKSHSGALDPAWLMALCSLWIAGWYRRRRDLAG